MATFIQDAVGQTYDEGHILVAEAGAVENTKKYFSILTDDFRNVVILKHEGCAAEAATQLKNLEDELGQESLIIPLLIKPRKNKSVIDIVATMPEKDFCGDLGACYKNAPLNYVRQEVLDAMHLTEDCGDYNREVILKIGTGVLAPGWHPDFAIWQTDGEKTVLTTDRVTFTRNMTFTSGETMTTAFAFEKGSNFFYQKVQDRAKCRGEPETVLMCGFNALCGFSGLKIHTGPYREDTKESIVRPAITIECYSKKKQNFSWEYSA
ncbi:MAG: hypothetical protein ACT4OY_01425 [Alphaproteobacteria bacterium]